MDELFSLRVSAQYTFISDAGKGNGTFKDLKSLLQYLLKL
jgi:hypothetical protein